MAESSNKTSSKARLNYFFYYAIFVGSLVLSLLAARTQNYPQIGYNMIALVLFILSPIAVFVSTKSHHRLFYIAGTILLLSPFSSYFRITLFEQGTIIAALSVATVLMALAVRGSLKEKPIKERKIKKELVRFFLIGSLVGTLVLEPILLILLVPLSILVWKEMK